MKLKKSLLNIIIFVSNENSLPYFVLIRFKYFLISKTELIEKRPISFVDPNTIKVSFKLERMSYSSLSYCIGYWKNT